MGKHVLLPIALIRSAQYPMCQCTDPVIWKTEKNQTKSDLFLLRVQFGAMLFYTIYILCSFRPDKTSPWISKSSTLQYHLHPLFVSSWLMVYDYLTFILEVGPSQSGCEVEKWIHQNQKIIFFDWESRMSNFQLKTQKRWIPFIWLFLVFIAKISIARRAWKVARSLN